MLTLNARVKLRQSSMFKASKDTPVDPHRDSRSRHMDAHSWKHSAGPDERLSCREPASLAMTAEFHRTFQCPVVPVRVCPSSSSSSSSESEDPTARSKGYRSAEVLESDTAQTPKMPSKERCQLRVNLIAEELNELQDAIKAGDLVEVADALW